MPTNSGTVGGVDYPLAAGTADTAIVDPLVDGLLAYFAHWLNEDLNTKLANIAGITDEAVPTGSTYGIDPKAGFVRNDFPALYMWRSQMRTSPGTLLLDWNRDQLTALYVFSQRELPHGQLGLRGLGTAVRDIFARATQTRSHRTFQPAGWPTGTDIMTAYDLLSIQFDGAEWGHIFETPGQRSAMQARPSGGDGKRQRAFPSVQAKWTVTQEIQTGYTLVDPDDVTRESLVELYEDGVSLFDRYAEAPDGSEDL